MRERDRKRETEREGKRDRGERDFPIKIIYFFNSTIILYLS